MNEDQLLLRDYLENQSEAAFSSLVDRYIPLVWATASRVSQSTLHADDLAQQVFLLLAKKANSLAHKSNLSGWLHRTTYLLALNQRRAEHRRLKYHREAHHNMNPPSHSSSENDWMEIAPALDECLHSLSERQRSFLFLRFFRNYRWAQIAEYHQTTEGAAKMQVHRALDRLRQQLGRSGVSLSSLALASLIQANLAPALPSLKRTELGNQINQTLRANSPHPPFQILTKWIIAGASLTIIAPLLLWLAWLSKPAEPETNMSTLTPEFNRQLEDTRSAAPSPLGVAMLKTITQGAHTTPEEKLRDALYNRHLLNQPSRAAVEAALKLFHESNTEAAVALLIEALQTPLEDGRWGEVISDGYYIGKEHQLAHHGLQFMGASAHSAIDFLLQQINQEQVYHHSRYPRTIRSLSPSPAITPGLVDAMDTHFYVQNVMGRELCELIADLANSDPEQTRRTKLQLIPLLDRSQPTLREIAPNLYMAVPEFNVLQDVVAVFQYSQDHSSKEVHQSLWDLASQYGPALSSLPKPGLNSLIDHVSEIDPQLAHKLADHLQRSFPELEAELLQP